MSNKRLVMKTVRLIPLVLAGFCGYLHTVINRRFDEMGDLIGSSHSSMDAPLKKAFGGDTRTREEQSTSEAITTLPAERVNMGKLQGPAVDLEETGRDTFEWKPPPEGVRVLANSAEYQDMLLHYTMNLLPNHRDPSASKGNDGAKAEHEEDDVNNPKPYLYNEIDVIVPASGQDDRLQIFAENLGVALKNFYEWYELERKPAILRRLKQEADEQVGADDNGETADSTNPNLDLKFRLLVTRYPLDEQKTKEDFETLLSQLSEKSTLAKDQIKLVRIGQGPDDDHPLKFNRAHARNVLHQNACGEDDCIVTAFDVDMQVLPIFFHRALQSVTPHVKAYFPIVFSEFNPDTVQMVQDFLYSPEKQQQQQEVDPMLEPFSRHRGLWRDFGYGMYVLAGSDAKRFRFNEEHQGWGHEDNDFYKLVHNNMRVDRQREHGLVHGWHGKNCAPGRDIITQQQWLDCMNSRDAMEGSALGLLLRPALKTYKLEDFPGLPKKYVNTKIIMGEGGKQSAIADDGDPPKDQAADAEDNPSEDDGREENQVDKDDVIRKRGDMEDEAADAKDNPSEDDGREEDQVDKDDPDQEPGNGEAGENSDEGDNSAAQDAYVTRKREDMDVTDNARIEISKRVNGPGFINSADEEGKRPNLRRKLEERQRRDPDDAQLEA